MAGKLTTHVLDLTHGCPAAGLTITLWSVQPQSGEKTRIKTVITNADGRTDAPLLMGEEFTLGVYELEFEIGPYFAAKDNTLPQPPFLDRVPLRFGIADRTSHYHVPLLASPWAYSTYRGS
jgi:5-hydroxyisourate hydrolase